MNEILKESKEFKIIFEKSMNLLNGKYCSKLKGDGLEYVDLKEYIPGDDIRKIDWKVTARENKVFVKEFLEEKDSSHYILIDTSLSQKNKIKMVKILATSLLLSSIKSKDGFSIIFFNNEEIKIFPLSKSKTSLMRYIYEISNIKLKSSGNLDVVIKKILSLLNKKSIISIISDEIELNNLDKSLLKALNKKHKVNYFFVYSSNEKNLDLGLSSYEDIETGFNSIYDLNEEELEEYKQEFDKQINKTKNDLLSIGIKPKIIDSDLDLLYQIKNFNGEV